MDLAGQFLKGLNEALTEQNRAGGAHLEQAGLL